MKTYPPRIEIQPLDRPVNATIRVPGSKSITNRALVLGALCEPLTGCVIDNALFCEDTEVMVEGLRALGFRVGVDSEAGNITVRRETTRRIVAAEKADLFVGNSGTTIRFLTALAALGQGRYRLDGVARMRERPMGDLLDALSQLGVTNLSGRGDGFPPIFVTSDGLHGGSVTIRGTISSQFLSALLMVAPMADDAVYISVVDGPLVSLPFVEMTVRMMEEFGVKVTTDGATWYHVPKTPWYTRKQYTVESDFTSASYFFAAAAIAGGTVHVPGLGGDSFQGDREFANVLAEMGCGVIHPQATVTRDRTHLHRVNVDMNALSDTVMTLAAVACFAEGPTTIRNVAHIRHKETDRIAALTTELRKLGVEVDEFPDGLRITPRPMHGAEIETYNDHRMAMSMALIGLKVPGVVIKNPGCVAKTYPGFWEDFAKLYG